MSATVTPQLVKSPHYLMWFRTDLRLHDNTALTAICEQALCEQAQQTKSEAKAKISAVFFITPEQWHKHDMSLAQADFICRTLPVLANDLAQTLNIQLQVIEAASFDDCTQALIELCQRQNITHIAANYEYEVNELTRDAALASRLANYQIEFNRYHDQCILPPQTVTTGDDKMYQVFTPFYKKWQTIVDASPPLLHETPSIGALDNEQVSPQDRYQALDANLKSISKLCQTALEKYQKLAGCFDEARRTDEGQKTLLEHTKLAYPAGECAARVRLTDFVSDDIRQYDIARDRPALAATSQLSAYLTIGAISPRLCYLQVQEALFSSKNAGDNKDLEVDDSNEGHSTDIQRWISELAWRDFYRHVIVSRPDIVRGHAYKKETDAKINWSYNSDDFDLWCQGMTGVPLVDAAMRCLNATGFMHNRLRMVTAMFLTKDLLIDWRLGERYFMQRLIDGDFAANNGGWQWSASVGTDAAPYFRIMNPFSQAKTHDKEATFIKTWLPELKDIPANILHDEHKLRTALGKGGAFAAIDYPVAMVEHKVARLNAIAQFKSE